MGHSWVIQVKVVQREQKDRQPVWQGAGRPNRIAFRIEEGLHHSMNGWATLSSPAGVTCYLHTHTLVIGTHTDIASQCLIQSYSRKKKRILGSKSYGTITELLQCPCIHERRVCTWRQCMHACKCSTQLIARHCPTQRWRGHAQQVIPLYSAGYTAIQFWWIQVSFRKAIQSAADIAVSRGNNLQASITLLDPFVVVAVVVE